MHFTSRQCFSRAPFSWQGAKTASRGKVRVSRLSPLARHPWHCLTIPDGATAPRQWGWHVSLCLWRCSSGGGVNESLIKAGGRAQRTRRGIQTVSVAGRANTFHTEICSCGEKNWKWQAGGFTFASIGLFVVVVVWFAYSALRFWGCECLRCLSRLFLQSYMHFP